MYIKIKRSRRGYAHFRLQYKTVQMRICFYWNVMNMLKKYHLKSPNESYLSSKWPYNYFQKLQYISFICNATQLSFFSHYLVIFFTNNLAVFYTFPFSLILFSFLFFFLLFSHSLSPAYSVLSFISCRVSLLFHSMCSPFFYHPLYFQTFFHFYFPLLIV